ncbi:hypothetical protein NDU88_004522 [Pleurodeles waltl]|uniref:Uncharacterized protein n=1 Tax=Pleurodeles waltl TaxID=8319 RepID=A0AAV7LIB0_PLEWA|nr:hypothetical protein NDU88_004522 [Pleurodeles waltl]
MTATQMRRINTPGQKSRPGVGGAKKPAFAPLFNAWVRAGRSLASKSINTGLHFYKKDSLCGEIRCTACQKRRTACTAVKNSLHAKLERRRPTLQREDRCSASVLTGNSTHGRLDRCTAEPEGCSLTPKEKSTQLKF